MPWAEQEKCILEAVERVKEREMNRNTESQVKSTMTSREALQELKQSNMSEAAKASVLELLRGMQLRIQHQQEQLEASPHTRRTRPLPTLTPRSEK